MLTDTDIARWTNTLVSVLAISRDQAEAMIADQRGAVEGLMRAEGIGAHEATARVVGMVADTFVESGSDQARRELREVWAAFVNAVLTIPRIHITGR